MTVGPPTITPENASPDTLILYGFLPQFLRDTDSENQYTFLSWLEGIGSQQQIVDDLCRDAQSGPGWSALMDIGRCPNFALPWLAQCVGVRFPGPIVGSDAVHDNLMRQYILAMPNFYRGTVATITAAAQAAVGSGIIKIIERYPDPYSFSVVYIDGDGSLDYSQLATAAPWYTSAGGSPNVTSLYPVYDDFPVSTEPDINATVQAVTPGGLIATVVNGS
jgi:hypothetical protein